MRKTTVLFPVFCSALLMSCVHEPKPVIKIEKVPLSIPANLLTCPDPEFPDKPATGDDGITTSVIIESLYASVFQCKANLEAIAKINGQ